MVLKGLHWAAHRLLIVSGYRFEQRRSGELKLGLWRKSFRDSGRKRLVIVPGFGDTPLSWMPVVSLLTPFLRRNFDELILVDFPGFRGFLASSPAFHSMDLLMEKLFDAFDSLKPHTIVGHSLGGWLTARYAALCGKGERPLETHPTRHRKYTGPESVILAGPSGAFGNETIREAWAERFRKARDEGFHHIRPHVFGKEPVWFRWMEPEFRRFMSSEAIAQFLSSVRDEHLVEDLLPDVRARVSLVWGEGDTLTPPICASVWLQKLPASCRARVVLLKKVGHSLQIESPALTAAALAQLLSDKPERPGLLEGKAAKALAGRWLQLQEGSQANESR